MPSSPIDTLKGRLAKGEISIDEYQQILAHLKGEESHGVTTVERTEGTSQKAAPNRFLESIFGPDLHMPADSNPLQINKRFVIHGSFFEYKGKRIEFGQINSIGADFDTQTINLISSSSNVVTLVLANQEKILLTGVSMVIAGRSSKLVQAAYKILSIKTFSNHRFSRYI